MTVKILADSACDLPLEFYKENNVTLFSLAVHLDGQDYEDLISITPNEVYDAMKNGKSPKTSQVSPHRFKEAFTQLAKDNEQAIYIAFSSQLSGTYQTAVMIKEEVREDYPNLDLTIIDTKCASLGVGLIVKEAAQLAANGASKEEIIDSVTFYCNHMEHIFTVDDLEYLARGGRISRTSAFLGGLLNIKPILNVEEGKLIPLEKIRGQKKVFKRIIDLIGERGKSLNTQTIAISHGNAEETALELKKLIQDSFNPSDVYINSIGAVIGSHAGPGTLAIFFLNDV